MSQEKAQLIAPIDSSFSVPGLTVSGVLTATTFDATITGVADSITQGKNLNVGVITALSFSGNLTGDAGGLIGSPNTVAGVVTANSFVGGITGNITGDVIGNASGIGASIKQGNNLNVGIATAVEWYGDGSGVTGAGSSAYVAQEITATPLETIIDLSYGNLIYYKGEANTTVGFASTSPAEQITFIRDTSPNFAYNVSYSTGGVTFDANGDYLTLSSSSDFNFGTGDYTAEAWLYPDSTDDRVWLNFGNTDNPSLKIFDGKWEIYVPNPVGLSKFGPAVTTGQWYHVAVSRSSGTNRLFVNGVLENSWTDLLDIPTQNASIGAYPAGTYPWDGKISNLRVVKGTALYTSNFVPPRAALTNVSGTVLLCCQDTSSTTVAAVTPGTITANGDPVAGAQTVSKSGTNTINATITWPDRVKWNDGTAPTLFTTSDSGPIQIFHLTTGDTGLNYNAWQEMYYDPTFTSGPIFGWARNQRGLNGQNDGPGNVAARSSPTQIGTGNWSSIDYGKAIDSSGQLFTWGENNYGLALNDRTSRSSPTQVGTDSTWQYAGAGGGVKTDGTMWQWGYNQTGNLGLNDLNHRSSPTQVPGSTWTEEFSGGNQHRVAVKTDGTLWCWGDNSDRGQLGQNVAGSTGNQSSPMQVGSGTDWSKVGKMFGGYGSAAIKTDGTLWMWGNNATGACGINNSTDTAFSSPVQVPGTTWKAISIIGTFSGGMATKTDGTLWSWGYNSQGTLGHNTGGAGTDRSSPIQVGTDNDWDEPLGALGGYGGGVTVRKTDNTMWAWGSNSYGEQAQNDRVARSSPTQVPGSWRQTAGGPGNGILGLKYS